MLFYFNLNDFSDKVLMIVTYWDERIITHIFTLYLEYLTKASSDGVNYTTAVMPYP